MQVALYNLSIAWKNESFLIKSISFSFGKWLQPLNLITLSNQTEIFSRTDTLQYNQTEFSNWVTTGISSKIKMTSKISQFYILNNFNALRMFLYMAYSQMNDLYSAITCMLLSLNHFHRRMSFHYTKNVIVVDKTSMAFTAVQWQDFKKLDYDSLKSFYKLFKSIICDFRFKISPPV